MTDLSEEAANWLQYLDCRFDLEPHERMLATQAAQVWDEIAGAKAIIAKEGLTIKTDRGGRKSNPAAAALRDNRHLFAKLIKQLDLGVELPPIPGARPHRRKVHHT